MVKKYGLFLLLVLCAPCRQSIAQTYELLDTITFLVTEESESSQIKNLLQELTSSTDPGSAEYVEAKVQLAYLMNKFGAPQHAIRIFIDLSKNPESYLISHSPSWYHRHLGNYYLSNKQYDSAIVHQKKAIEYKRTEQTQPGWESYMLNDLGISYYEAGNLGQAENIFKRCIRILQTHRPEDLNFLARINDNLGQVYLAKFQPDSAYALFVRNKSYLAPRLRHKLIQADIRIASCLILKKKPQEAETILNQSFLAINDSTDHRIELYNMLLEQYLKLSIAKGDFRLENIVMKRTLEYKTLLESQFNGLVQISIGSLDRILSTRWEALLSSKELELKEQRTLATLAKQNQRVTTQRYLIFSIVVLFLTTIVIIHFRARARKLNSRMLIDNLNQKVIESNLENEKLKSKQLSEHLEHQKQDLINASLEIERKQKWLEQLQNRLTEETNDSEVTRRIKSVINDLKAHMLTEEKNQKFFSQIDIVNRNFYARLRRKFPELTQKELELCGLLRLHMSIKEIALYRNVAPDSIKTARKRLRKKLHLTPDININEFLHDIN